MRHKTDIIHPYNRDIKVNELQSNERRVIDMKNTRNMNKKGFTLVEATLVIAIILIMAGAIGVSFSEMKGRAVAADAKTREHLSMYDAASTQVAQRLQIDPHDVSDLEDDDDYYGGGITGGGVSGGGTGGATPTPAPIATPVPATPTTAPTATPVPATPTPVASSSSSLGGGYGSVKFNGTLKTSQDGSTGVASINGNNVVVQAGWGQAELEFSFGSDGSVSVKVKSNDWVLQNAGFGIDWNNSNHLYKLNESQKSWFESKFGITFN